MIQILDLWKHQQKTVQLRHKSNIVADFSDPGTGKTRAHLFALATREKRKRALVLCPKTLMQSAWGDELDETDLGLTYQLGYAENWKFAIEQMTDLFITNIDGVKRLAKLDKRWFRNFDEIIIDEATAFKHRTSARSKAADAISRHFEYRTIMTGTPNPNSVTELWQQIKLLDEGERLGNNYFKFRMAVCEAKQIGPRPEHIRWEDKAGVADSVFYMLKDITIRHPFSVMKIPPNYMRTVKYHPSKKLLKAYLEMEDRAILELESQTITAVHAASLRTKLLQIASGTVYSGADGRYATLDEERYELILDLVEERRHSVVFYNWKHQRDQLCAEALKRNLRFAVIDGETSDRARSDIKHEYQAGKYQVLFMHPKTGAHGLTLTRGEAVIWSSPVYEADLFEQGMHRIVRGGQTKKTETICVEAVGTVERQVFERLRMKGERMDNFRNLLVDARARRKRG